MVHQTVEERAAVGRAARTRAPRSGFGTWQPAADRADPVGLLEQQAATRVPDLVPLRYGRMVASAFTFYRGGALLMAADLASMPRTNLTVQLCGDAHLSNFGLFAAPDRRSVFSLNDFDETLPGPFEWDVERLVASFVVAARDRGFTDRERTGIASACARAYREAMREFATTGRLDLWYRRLDIEDIQAQFSAGASKREIAGFQKVVAKSQSRTRMAALAKLTHVVDGRLRFVSTPPLIVPIEEIATGAEAEQIDAFMQRVLRAYRRSLQDDRKTLLEQYHYVHLAHKVVGVGSVGTRAWVMLLEGRDQHDALILQLKEAQPSVLEAFLGTSKTSNHGQRVVRGQRLMQAASDIMLGWQRTHGADGVDRDYYVRQLWDAKGSAEVERMAPDGMRKYATLCGRTLALAHARSGDAVEIGAYLGSGDVFDRAMVEFGEAYADQNERDHAALQAAIAAGRVTAQFETG